MSLFLNETHWFACLNSRNLRDNFSCFWLVWATFVIKCNESEWNGEVVFLFGPKYTNRSLLNNRYLTPKMSSNQIEIVRPIVYMHLEIIYTCFKLLWKATFPYEYREILKIVFCIRVLFIHTGHFSSWFEFKFSHCSVTKSILWNALLPFHIFIFSDFSTAHFLITLKVCSFPRVTVSRK